MQYFTELANSHREALDLIRAKYGESAQVLSHKTVRMGGFFGFFAKDGVEVTGYIRPDRPTESAKQPRPQDFEEEKRKILAHRALKARRQRPTKRSSRFSRRSRASRTGWTRGPRPRPRRRITRRYAVSTRFWRSTTSPSPSVGRLSPDCAGTSRSRPSATSRRSNRRPSSGWATRSAYGREPKQARPRSGGGPGSSLWSGRRESARRRP